MSIKRKPRYKNGRIFSLELRDGSWALLQMMGKNGQYAVFSHFRKGPAPDWTGIKLGPEDVLFRCWILDSVLRSSTIRLHIDIPPVEGLEFPVERIYGGSFRKVRFWPGTDHERELLVFGDPEKILLIRHTFVDGEYVESTEKLEKSDYENLRHLELSNLRNYPEFNERLLLCAQRGENYDPLKEIAFDRPLGLDALTYIDIISGKVAVSELGY